MKKNRKGFMLAEVVVTSTIVMTAMISLYFTFNKIYTRYNTLATYRNIDGMYAIENIVDNLIEDKNTSQNINAILANKQGVVIENGTCSISSLSYCNEAKAVYNIQNMYIVKKDVTEINNLKKDVTNNTFKDYLEYTKTYYKYDTTDNNHYLIILEYKINNEYNYSSMELG